MGNTADWQNLFGPSLVGMGLQGDGPMGQPALSLFRGDDLEPSPPSSPPTGPLTVEDAFDQYCSAKELAPRTRDEYRTTIKRLVEWRSTRNCGRSVTPMQVAELLDRASVKEWIDWVFEQAVAGGDGNPGRTANKRREHLHAVLSWLHKEERIHSVPRFPDEKTQRDAAGKFYFNDAKLDDLYWATYQLEKPRAWPASFATAMAAAGWRRSFCSCSWPTSSTSAPICTRSRPSSSW